MIEIKSFATTDTGTVVDAFMAAFADYAVSFNRSDIISLLNRRGYDNRLSFGALDNNAIAAFALNGIGLFNDTKTAYDTGTGTLPEYRGKGLAGKILDFSINILADNGIRQYLLEALTDNAPAIKVYRNQGFEITREFTCHSQLCADITLKRPDSLPSRLEIREINPAEVIALQHFCDFTPSWQNSSGSILRAVSELRAFSAVIDGKTEGYAVIDPDRGDLTQIAVNPGVRHNGIGSLLLNTVIDHNRFPRVKALNIQSDCQSLITFLLNRNLPVASRQYEMIKPL